MDKRPILGITMGDPSGNGPEISVKALMNPSVYEKCRPLIVGDGICMEAAVKVVKGAEAIKVNRVKCAADAKFEYGVIDVLDMGIIDMLCCWFAGSDEGNADISIAVSRLKAGESQWSIPVIVSDDPERSE